MAQETKRTAKDHTKIGAVIILVISAIVFIPFGGYEVISAFFSNKDVPVFGSYDGKKITYERGSLFTNMTENLAERYKSMGYQIDSNAYYYLFTQAFAETVKDMAYLDSVKSTGYEVPAGAVNRMLLNYYSDENGNYSPKLYNQTDKSTKKSLRESVTKNLQYNRLRDDLLGSSSLFVDGQSLYGIKSNSKEADFINNMGKEKHSFKYVAFNTEDFPKTEAVVWAKKDNHKDKFVKYDLSVVTLDSKDDAEALLKQLNSNEVTFEDAVSEKSTKYYTDSEGKISRPYRYQLEISVPEKADVEKVVSLAQGSLSEVIATSRGFSIFRADGAAKDADLNDSETVDVILTYIKTNEHGYIEDYYSNIAGDFTAQVALSSFEEAAKNFGLNAVQTTAFPVNYGSSSLYSTIPASYGELANLSTNAEVLQKIFALKEGEVSAPVVLSSNVMVFRCTGVLQDSENVDEKRFAANMASLNSSTATQTLMTSDKVVNNVWEAYFTNFAKFGDDKESD